MRKENKLYSEKNQPLFIRSREKYAIKDIASKLNAKKMRVPVGMDKF